MVFKSNLQFLICAYYSPTAVNMATDCRQGMAPTLMVACVSLAGDNDVQETPSRGVSSFVFHARSMHVYLTQSITDG